MEDCSKDLRDAYYTALNGQVTYNSVIVPVYNNAPKDATYPMILISAVTVSDSRDKMHFNTSVTASIDIVDKYLDRGTNVKIDSISNSILKILCARTKINLTNFAIITTNLESAEDTEELADDALYKMKTLRISNYIQEL